jgi:hypothetical protein
MAREIEKIYARVADVLVSPLTTEERQSLLAILDKVAESITPQKSKRIKETAVKN